MNKKQVRTLIVALLVVIVALYFIASTYARYTTSLTGNAEATVAKWSAVVKDGTNTLSDNFTLTFTVDANEFVRDNRIAPQTSATAQVEIDLTGTEVATDLTATITDTVKSTFFGASASDVTVSTSFAKVGTTNFEISNAGLVSLPTDGETALSGKVEMTITLTWTNDDNHNVSDTAVGTKADGARTFEMPVTVTAQQHIG
jgi:ABC-type glycerol-3-phosphate transport system permease component